MKQEKPNKSNDYSDSPPSVRGVVIRWLTGLFFRTFRKSIKKLGLKYSEMTRKSLKSPKGFKLEKHDIGGIYAEMLIPDKAAPDRVILQLHGGAYIYGMSRMYRRIARNYSRLTGNVRVLTIDYRLAPQHPFPAAFEDSLAAYRWLLDNGYSPEKIILLGDSAGGGLSLATAMALRDRCEPVPGALVLMSPWADLASQGKSHTEKYNVDPMFGRKTRGGDISALAYTTRDNLKNPYVSPVYGDFSGLPPMLVHVGECEVLLSDSETVVEKARAAGVPVEFRMWKGMFHVFQMFYGIVPEAASSIRTICRFMKDRFEQI